MNYSGKSKMMKRYKEGGPVDEMEAANQSEESQDIASSMGAGERNTDEPEYKSFKEAFAAERKAGNKTFEYMGKKYTTDMAARTAARDTGSDVARKAASYPKPGLRAETNRDRAERYVAKRAAARAEAAANPARGRSGVMLANGGVVKRASAKSHGKAC